MGVLTAVIGVDVGGTNTDAVIVDKSGDKPIIISKSKTTTTTDVTSGVSRAIHLALLNSKQDGRTLAIQQVNIGTTHFINAVIEGKRLAKVAVIRLCGTASKKLPPFSDFRGDLTRLVRGSVFMINGGYQFDGQEITKLDKKEVIECVEKIKIRGEKNIVVSGIFSPLCPSQEDIAVGIIKKEYPDVSVTASHTIGKLGLLERENAAILNECIKPLCQETIKGFRYALNDLGLYCPVFLTQNDGTVLSEDTALLYPVLSFASGATNSMRGAAFLSGVTDGIIVDIGGTSTDVGVLMNGYPREASAEVKIGGIKTNFRMPDVVSVGLGGGSYVRHCDSNSKESVKVGPLSAGYRLTSEALVFSEDIHSEDRQVTALDIAVASGFVNVGNKNHVKHLEPAFVNAAQDKIHNILSTCIDQMRFNDRTLPLVLVGGGSVIIDNTNNFDGVSKVIVPEGFDVANAVGAALSQVSASSEQIIDLATLLDKVALDRDTQNELSESMSLSEDEKQKIVESVKLRHVEVARQTAMENIFESLRADVIASGAIPATVSVVDKDDVTLAYIPGFAKRFKMKVVGELNTAQFSEAFLVPDAVYNQHLVEGHQDSKQTVTSSGKILTEDLAVLTFTEPNVNLKTEEWFLSKYDVECLSIGAGIMGCGGGGNPHIGLLLALNALESGKQIRVITPSKFFDSSSRKGLVALVAGMGAPLISYEKLQSGNETVGALQCMQDLCRLNNYDFDSGRFTSDSQAKQIGIKTDDGLAFVDDFQTDAVAPSGRFDTATLDMLNITAVMCAEVGGMNCIEPLIVAAELGLPVLDCDGMGRAFPELQMFSPFIYGHKPYPATLADDKGRRAAVFFADGPKRLENHFRNVVISMGCSAGVTFKPLSEEEVMKTTVLFSISHAWRIGNTVMRARARKQSPVQAVVEVEHGQLIISGKIKDVLRETTGGFNKGNVTIDGLDEYTGKAAIIDFQNEFLVCREVDKSGASHVRVCVPDLITLMDADTAQPIPTEELRFGMRVAVVAMRVHPLMSTDQALKYVGPQAFGLGEDVRYRPLGDFIDAGPVGPK